MLLLNKLLPLFFLPFGLVCGLVVCALWSKKWWPGLLALFILYVCSISVVSSPLIGWLETRYPEIPLERVEPADAVVVLGGILGPRSMAQAQPNWLETVERFDAGVALVQSGKAGHLVFTGARMPWEDRETTEGVELQRLAIARGVPPGKILVTRLIDNTATEAAAIAGLMKEQGWRRIILVTTGWHMPRSVLLFRKAGVNFIPFPVDFRSDRTRTLSAIDFVPKAEAWQMTETALREGYGWIFYALPRP
ncbi:MAG: YdcF family protein [Opitutae bacterium]